MDKNPIVHTDWIMLDGSAQPAYLALPPAGQGPGLLLWQEIFGVNTHIRAVAEQYALAGFVVLAPDVFWRQQSRVELGYEGADRDRGRAMAMALKPDEVATDIASAVATLKALPASAGRALGTLGYCLGGRLAYLAAAQPALQADLRAAVAYYGGGIQGQLPLAAGISADLLFHYAEHDEHIPLDAVEQVRVATSRPGNECHVYAGAQHGFNCWARASYQPAAAALALGRSIGFLAQRLF